MDVTVSMAGVEEKGVSVEFGGYGLGEVEIRFDAGLQIGLSYEQAERLWKEMAPYFIVDEGECQRIIERLGSEPVSDDEC